MDIPFEAIRNAAIAGFFTSIAAGIIGVYVVIRKMVSMSGSVAHASLSGIGLGLVINISPVFGALILTPIGAVGMGFVVKKTKLSEDTAIGMLWATGMALGVILAALAGNTSDLSTYLFGDILSVPDTDLVLMGALDVVIIGVVVRFYNAFISISFDEEFGKVVGVPVLPLYFLLLILIALTVVTMLRVAGIILVIALLAIPAALSRRITYNVPKMMLLSCLFAGLFTFSGLYISLEFAVPSGAVIALLCGTVFSVFLLVSRSIQNRQNRTGE